MMVRGVDECAIESLAEAAMPIIIDKTLERGAASDDKSDLL